MADVDIIKSMTDAAHAIQKVVADVRKAADTATANINKMQAEAAKTMGELDKTINQKFVDQDARNQKSFKSIADDIAKFRTSYSDWAKRVNKENAEFQAFVREHLEKHLQAGEIFREVKKE